MKLTERINFRQPKYMLPAIVYLPLLGASYFIFDLFDTKVAEKKDANMGEIATQALGRWRRAAKVSTP